MLERLEISIPGAQPEPHKSDHPGGAEGSADGCCDAGRGPRGGQGPIPGGWSGERPGERGGSPPRDELPPGRDYGGFRLPPEGRMPGTRSDIAIHRSVQCPSQGSQNVPQVAITKRQQSAENCESSLPLGIFTYERLIENVKGQLHTLTSWQCSQGRGV